MNYAVTIQSFNIAILLSLILLYLQFGEIENDTFDKGIKYFQDLLKQYICLNFKFQNLTCTTCDVSTRVELKL